MVRPIPTTLSYRSRSTFLPLWKRVIFVDWFGVMSRTVFWWSILHKPEHRFYSPLSVAAQQLFQNTDLITNWMRGGVTFQQILSTMDLPTKGVSSEFWKKRLLLDCRRTRWEEELRESLKELSNQGSFIVLATDNMDCFYDSIDSITGLNEVFDSVLCSSNQGVLKAEAPERFFGPWLQSHSIPWSEARLIDDSQKNCDAFCKLGGKPYHALDQTALRNVFKELLHEFKQQ
jgi:hypothetical protein